MTVMDHGAHHTTTAHDHDAHQAHAGHAGHAGHEGHAGHRTGGVTWGAAAKATLHCLTGCAIGEILGMVIGTALMWGNVQTMILAITLAFVFGYSFTLFAVRRAGLDWKSAIKVALAADTVSIAVMELVDNSIIALTPGAMDAHLSDGLFWGALLGGFAVAFLVTTPVNKWMIGRGKGHAVVHAYH
ncbi:DUF4396 domain-containing protein [Streptomyces sp. F8]|uniref:DUF4396 domain-containing protein n=2 Tax=Streptomyces TaxID=1883 RepID=A0ABX3G5D6_9ACTN|nr:MULTISPECIES: DUF4396 domain-containing protein [Streptomyces]AQT76249.1 hypothetical protein B1K54_02455 [Streptomyces sp. fd1-xmd]MDX6760086.1 DUF4396 domain-containing protein [Streptomyces sp. F8]OLZ69656.1 hypothetical protein AVW11_10060 [Streptomyces amritsarensis]